MRPQLSAKAPSVVCGLGAETGGLPAQTSIGSTYSIIIVQVWQVWKQESKITPKIGIALLLLLVL